jgi:hypothetical protein
MAQRACRLDAGYIFEPKHASVAVSGFLEESVPCRCASGEWR